MKNKNLNKNMKGFALFLFLVVVVLFLAINLSATYTRSYVSNTQFGSAESGLAAAGFGPGFDRALCEAGQDFILQISPFGCTPAVVRSDLLEEQNVPVFCKISATQLNPLIKVNAIDNIHITGERPPEVSSIGYFPARAALGRFGAPVGQVNQPVLDNVGYAVINLKRQPNESAMPDFVEGNLLARIRYDVENAFGVGRSVFYLPQLIESEWENNFRSYSFWNGKGYLRAEDVDESGASISIYSDRSFGSFVGGEKTRVANVRLEKGQTSHEIFIPGFEYCLGGLTLRLNGIEDVDTRARIKVNENFFELEDEESFLEGGCRVKNIEKQGLFQEVKVSCKEDGGSRSFNLIIAPRIELEIDGKSNNYSLGDWLYPESLEKSVYLARIGVKEDVSNRLGLGRAKENLEITLITKRGSERKLSENVGDVKIFLSKFILNSESLSFGEREGEEIFGKTVKVIGYADSENSEVAFDSEVKKYYDDARKIYEEVSRDFSSETYPEGDSRTLGEKALWNLTNLANYLGQKEDVLVLCSEFEERYPESQRPEVCTSEYELSNEAISSRDVSVNGKIYRLSFEGVMEPRFEDYGAEILIEYFDGTGRKPKTIAFRKGQIFYLNPEEDELKDEFIQLVKVENNGDIEIRVVVEKTGTGARVREALDPIRKRLRRGEPDDFGSDNYRFTLRNVNLNKVAKVSVVPRINYAETQASFPFKIGIEKRNIQLTPEKTREKMESVQGKLDIIQGIQTKLEPVVENLKAVCLGVGATLTIKNFVSNLGGEGIARQKVMRGNEGWFEKCKDLVDEGEHGSVDSCLLNNSKEIGNAVEKYQDGIKTLNDRMDSLEEGITNKNFFGEDVVDTNKLFEGFVNSEYTNELKNNLQSHFGDEKIDNGAKQLSEIADLINSETVTLTQARDLTLNTRLLSSDDPVVRAIAENEVRSILGDVWANEKGNVERTTLAQKYGFDRAISGATEEISRYALTEDEIKTFGEVKNQFILSPGTETAIENDDFVIIFRNENDGKEYLLVLTDDYNIDHTYEIREDKHLILRVGNEGDANPLDLGFDYFDAKTYKNPFQDPRIRYYEAGNYKGLPGIVPFDLNNGWYASVKSTLPVAGNIRAFGDSGRVSSFYLCNVGKNGREDFNSGTSDDICQGMNLDFQDVYNQFYGLEKNEAESLTRKAVEAIRQASEAHKPGVQKVRLNIPGLSVQTILVGEPMVDIPDIQCQDFMSPVECNILFNVCDPVICPSSRCDFGGEYPVGDVIQSGIGGSALLCLPNFPEVKVPICLSGINAGLQGWASVLDSYNECLKTSLETGQTIGVCDEINSIYQCDLFWRQAVPVAQILVPKATGKILGQDVRGGGEYLGVKDAFDKAGDSLDFFSQNYARNSFTAFKSRSTEDVGGAFCKNFASLVYPGGDVFDNLISADSPPQFLGNFDEIPFTTATNPPISQYKVFYHIFAGRDSRAFYEVYLKGTGSSFFQDAAFKRIVARGFIGPGEYATATEDFTAQSGYREMCIVVNNREECGFKEVTTEVGFTFIRDQYLKQQVTQDDISSERECVSGTPNALDLIGSGVQIGVGGVSLGGGLGAAENIIDPQLYNKGITRVCATKNPGEGSDPSAGTADARWKEVGNCGNVNLKCWLDTESVVDTIRSTKIEGEILEEFANRELNALKNQLGEDYIGGDDFDILVGELGDLNNDGNNLRIIRKVGEAFDRVIFGHEKAYLLLVKGDALGNIARNVYNALKESSPDPEGDETPGEEDETEEEVSEDGEPGIIPGTTVIPSISNEVENAIKSSDSSNLQYPVFKFDKNGIIPGGITYYVYSERNWFWSENKEKWINSQLSSFENSNIQDSNLAQQDVTRFVSDLDVFDRQNEENQNFIRKINGKSYSQGVNELIGLTRENDGGTWYDLKVKSKLSTESVDFGPDGVFHIKIRQISYPVEYSFGEREWKHTLLFPGEQVPQEIADLIEALDGKLFEEGPVIIFSIDSASDFDSFSETLSCNSPFECRKFLGNKIKRIANEIQDSREGSDDFDVQVRADTGVKNFECLILQMAYLESTVQQCKPIQEDGNPLYCENDVNKLVLGDPTDYTSRDIPPVYEFLGIDITDESKVPGSVGIMQINLPTHGGDLVQRNIDITDFETNVRFGVNLLIDNYGSGSREYICTSEPYSGWQRALRGYNGWSVDKNGNEVCRNDDGTEKGNHDYVDDVIIKVKDKDGFKNLFQECGIDSSPGQVIEGGIIGN